MSWFVSLVSRVTQGYDKRKGKKKKKQLGVVVFEFDENSFSKNGLKNMHPKSEVYAGKNRCLALWILPCLQSYL